ncbi:MAG: YjbE family putative metal transport protein [Acetobacteraceae bacterium]|jgi:YjbE family integral membrane protein|nr:YjbE family putative metal transport protein [Acetobacteraceae bacterium]
MDFSAILENFNLATFGQIMFANIVLSGDNAVLIGLAAAGLPAAQRSRAILFGMIFATVLRVIFSIFAVYLLEVPGLLLIGGLLLLWIAYGFFKELREEKAEEEDPEGHEDGAGGKTMAAALKQIVIADVSMSLDNVLAIAGIARGNLPMLILGLGVSIILMGVAASIIARLLAKFRWIAYAGVALIAWIGIEMTYEGAHQLYGYLTGSGHGHAERLIPDRGGNFTRSG